MDEPRSTAEDPPHGSKPPDNAGRNAAIWSFFAPPVGFVLGWIALRRYRREGADRNSIQAAQAAILNSIVSSVVLVVGVVVLAAMWRWYRSMGLI